MILVPYEKNEIAQATRRSELDEQMAKVLQRNDLDDRAKFRLYQRLLELYLRHQQKTKSIKTFENSDTQTFDTQKANFSTQTINEASVQTSPEKSTISVQTDPIKSKVDSQTSFSENDKNILGNTLIDDYQYDTYNPPYFLDHNNSYNPDLYRSIFEPRRSNLNDLNWATNSQLGISYLKPNRIKKKLELDYNEPTPQKPSLLQKSVPDLSLNESLNQPTTKLDISRSKIFETPDATKNEISSYSPTEKNNFRGTYS